MNTTEALESTLLGAVLSYVLLRRGYEPLHATVLSLNGRGVGLLGDSGYGKSSLGACLIAEHGYTLVTDDLLVVRDPTEPIAELGLQRLKLEPAMASQFFHTAGPTIAPEATKMLIPMCDDQSADGGIPLAGLFALPAPSQDSSDVQVVRRSESDAFQSLIENSFNSVIIERIRLADQFVFAEALARRVPMFGLAYPRGLEHLRHIAGAVIDQAARL